MAQSQHRQFFDCLLKNAKLFAQLLNKALLGEALALGALSQQHQDELLLLAELTWSPSVLDLERVYMRFLSRLYQFCEWEVARQEAAQVGSFFSEVGKLISGSGKSASSIQIFLQKFQDLKSKAIVQLAQTHSHHDLMEKYRAPQKSKEKEVSQPRCRPESSIDPAANPLQAAAAKIRAILNVSYNVLNLDHDHFISCVNLYQSREESKRLLKYSLTQRNRTFSNIISLFLRKTKRRESRSHSPIKRYPLPRRQSQFHNRSVAEPRTSIQSKLAPTNPVERRKSGWGRAAANVAANIFQTPKVKTFQHMKSRVYKLKKTNLTIEQFGLSKEEFSTRQSFRNSQHQVQGLNFNLTRLNYVERSESLERGPGELRVHGREICPPRGECIRGPLRLSFH